MRTIIISLLLISAFNTQAYAQKNIDSLWQIWKELKQNDTNRLKAIDAISWGMRTSNPDSAIILANLELRFAEEKKQKKWVALALNTIGAANYIQSNYSKAIESYQKGIGVREEIGDVRGIGALYNNIGAVYYDMTLYSKALEFFQKGLVVFEKLHYTEGIESSYTNIGSVYKTQKNYPRAIEYFEKALTIDKEIGDKQGIAYSYNNFGNVYVEMADYTKALDYFQKGLSILKDLNDTNGMGAAYNNIGTVYQSQQNFTEAYKYFYMGLTMRLTVGNKFGIAIAYFNIGDNYLSRKEYTKAITWCQNSLTLGKETGSLEVQQLSCKCLYNANRTLGKYNDALKYHEQYIVLSDSLRDDSTVKKLQLMEFTIERYSDSLKQVEIRKIADIKHLSEINERDRRITIFTFVIVLSIIVVIGLVSRMRYIARSKAIINELLLNILPKEIVKELTETKAVKAKRIEMASILFTDFQGFTEVAEKLSPEELVALLHQTFTEFDRITDVYNIEKIKTIGDSYMAAGGLFITSPDNLKNTVLAAIEMQSYIEALKKEREDEGKLAFNMRAGIEIGSIVGGVVGKRKYQFDIWGDAVNTASRMESSGKIGKVNVSKAVYSALKDDPELRFEYRDKVEAKNKGLLEMYFVYKT